MEMSWPGDAVKVNDEWVWRMGHVGSEPWGLVDEIYVLPEGAELIEVKGIEESLFDREVKRPGKFTIETMEYEGRKAIHVKIDYILPGQHCLVEVRYRLR